jgi:hypothetical protein
MGILPALPNDLPVIMFDNSSDLQVTITYSLAVKRKTPIDFAVARLGFHENKGYDYTEIVKPNLVPSGPDWGADNNLFFENGEVKEENIKDKSWVKYQCDKQTLLNWLNYVESGAGLIVGIAQYALQHPGDFTVTESVGATVFKPKAGVSLGGMENLFESVGIRKAPPRLLREIVIRPDPPIEPREPALLERYSYGFFEPS